MKTALRLFRSILLPACLFFTVLCFVFSAILSHSDTEMTLPTINLSNLFQIFLFSLVLSASNLLFSCRRLSYPLALTLHFVCFLADISIVFFLIGGHFNSERGAFTILFVFAILYLVIAAVASTVRHFLRTDRNNKEAYKRQFN